MSNFISNFGMQNEWITWKKFIKTCIFPQYVFDSKGKEEKKNDKMHLAIRFSKFRRLSESKRV